MLAIGLGAGGVGASGCTLKPSAGGLGSGQGFASMPNGDAIGRGGRFIAPKPFGRSVSAIVYPSVLSSSIVSHVEGA